MKPNKQLLAAWKRGEPLGDAWLRLADKENKQRYHRARRAGSHSSIQISLEIDLIARLEEGELQAIGIEAGSNPVPVLIPQYFFSKTAEIDLSAGTVADFGKTFHQVRVEGPPEAESGPIAEVGPIPFIDPKLISGFWKTATESSPSESETSNEAPMQAEQELAGETISSEPEPSNEQLIPGEREPTEKTPAGEQARSIKPQMGRPPLLPKIRDVVRELINGNEFENLSKKEIVTRIRLRAKQRFSAFFSKPSQPSLNKINEALKAEGWPPVPT